MCVCVRATANLLHNVWFHYKCLDNWWSNTMIAIKFKNNIFCVIFIIYHEIWIVWRKTLCARWRNISIVKYVLMWIKTTCDIIFKLLIFTSPLDDWINLIVKLQQKVCLLCILFPFIIQHIVHTEKNQLKKGDGFWNHKYPGRPKTCRLYSL